MVAMFQSQLSRRDEDNLRSNCFLKGMFECAKLPVFSNEAEEWRPASGAEAHG